MYSRNKIYITPEEQEKLRDFHIFIAGVGLGSIIAECALRLGFEHITIIDGDVVEESNLNRQNYTYRDIGKSKAETLKNRLLSINPNAKITAYHQFLTSENVHTFITGVDVTINTIDFTSDAPFVFDNVCVEQGIPALHPYNLGWGGCVFLVTDKSENLSYISNKLEGFEVQFADYIVRQLTQQGPDMLYLSKAIQAHKNEKMRLPPPQLPVASWIVAGLCTDMLFRLATGKEVKLFPDFYFKKL